MASRPPIPAVRVRDDLASPGVAALVNAVQKAIGERGVVTFGLRASALVRFDAGLRGRQPKPWQTEVAERVVDVVVCDPATLRPLAAAAADGEVRQLLTAAGLPCVDAEGDVEAVAASLVTLMKK